MPGVVLYPPVLVCAHCGHRELARPVKVPLGGGTSVMHACRALGGLAAPLVAEGDPRYRRYGLERVSREDYVGREVVARDEDGRVAMATEITRDDGTDRAVLAPCAMGEKVV